MKKIIKDILLAMLVFTVYISAMFIIVTILIFPYANWLKPIEQWSNSHPILGNIVSFLFLALAVVVYLISAKITNNSNHEERIKKLESIQLKGKE